MDIKLTSSEIYKYLHPIKECSILSSAALNKITNITNQYFANNNIYIKHPHPVIPKEYYFLSRGSNKSLICRFMYFHSLYKLYMDSLNRLKYFTHTFSPEYKYSYLKIEMENYYTSIITERMITTVCNLYSHNSNLIQRSNKHEDFDMKALEIINNINLNSKSKKFHK